MNVNGLLQTSTSTYKDNYKNWNNYNLKVSATEMSLEGDLYMQKRKDGYYNIKTGNYSNDDHTEYFMVGYNKNARAGNGYQLQIDRSQVSVGDFGGAGFLVNNYPSNTSADWNRSMMFYVNGYNNSGRQDLILKPGELKNDEDRMEMYMRKGYLNINGVVNMKGDNNKSLLKLVDLDQLRKGTPGGSNNGPFYDSRVSETVDETGPYVEYQLNPAYTSVMHDIKLATRGGARLSDILPDFINKGIYVMDNTYTGHVNWENATVTGGNGDYNIKEGTTSLSNCNSTKCDTSAWMGFIPTPNCPPGYMQVATITPIRFAMAQAGVPIQVDNQTAGDGKTWTGGIEGVKKDGTYLDNYRVLGTRKDPRGDKISVGNGSNYRSTGDTLVHVYDNGAGYNIKVDGDEVSKPDAPQYWADVYNHPYTFQVSTWLNTTLKAYKTDKTKDETFKGWHGIMGFIYPAADYADYLKAIGAKNDTDTISDQEIIWNLFPVYKEELSAIATVYCYFDRQFFEGTNTDKYLPHKATSIDNIRYKTKSSATQNVDGKNDNYLDRLNDPNLGYRNYW